MASLNLLQWREQSSWRRYRTLHSLGILLVLVVCFLSVQWVVHYGGYLDHLEQQITEHKAALKKQKRQQQLRTAYQQKQKAQRAFVQLKSANQRQLNAFYALLYRTHQNLQHRELSLSGSQFQLRAEYQQMQDVNDHYVWLEKQLPQARLKQQLLPQRRVLFHYSNNPHGAKTNG
ncbi:hypothetical protein [Idiomarina sp. HP20-50]|uniref:hypothetical protein n=1 Tax=Idiomarina sp. HP20-50 TaxID=3070813 RepID=UPI00294B42FF|nr:hypothetical protein [Idiomarina sp. HP20-50]MDV6316634.1 hypothetical protein [Idiomarina sp. HP20-50]